MSPHRHDRVVVGIPVYNEERFVVECIRSMQAQTMTDFLCLISDNASTDDTEAVCRAAIADDARFVYVRQPTNMGSSPNINFLMRASASPYFAWIGSHDRVKPDFLVRHVAFLDANPEFVASYTYWEWIDAESRVVGREPIKGLGELWGGRWSRYLWSIESAEVGGLQAVMRREILPDQPMRNCPGCDHVLLSSLVFKGRFNVLPQRLYQARRFVEAARPVDYMERITGRKGQRRDLSELVTAYIEEFERLPAPPEEKDRWRGLAHWIIQDKFSPDSRRWHRKFGISSTIRRLRALRRWKWLLQG